MNNLDDQADAPINEPGAASDEDDDPAAGKLQSGHASDKLLLPSWMHAPNQLSANSKFYAERKKWTATHIKHDGTQDERHLFVELHKYYLRTHHEYSNLWQKYVLRCTM